MIYYGFLIKSKFPAEEDEIYIVWPVRFQPILLRLNVLGNFSRRFYPLTSCNVGNWIK